MLTQLEIKNALLSTIEKYPIKAVSLFGSYAEGNATDNSDVDLLIEFITPQISLFSLYEIKADLEEILKKKVDLIHGPIADDSMIKVDKVVKLYEH